MKEIIIATKNKGKVKEFEAIFSPYGISIKSLYDYPMIKDIEETGDTFAENAIIKAEQLARELRTAVIADDSGLAVDALNGEPGVYSARYAGSQKDDCENIKKVLKKLEGVPIEKRTARFHCALAFSIPNGETYVVEGTCEGRILDKPAGENGFGYDPIFYIEEKGKTMAQISAAEKNKLSHRAAALRELTTQFARQLGMEE